MTPRLVRAGEIIAVPASVYGVVMRHAPEDGVVFEHGGESVYVPASRLDEARKLIGKAAR